MHWTEISQRVVGRVVVLDLHGQMTLSGDEEPRLLRYAQGVSDAGYRHVVLNLAHVDYVDSTGVGEIVGAYTRMVRTGGMLTLCGVSPRIQDLLDAANISAVVHSFPSEAAAVESFSS